MLIGLGVGLLTLSIAGRVVPYTDWHPDFNRFTPHLTPETQYEPTIGELCAIVRANCRPDQILVIIGGNSILQGVGQPGQMLWSRRLQEILGDRYAVVNLAFRGSEASDGGAVAAEVLRQEFPRQIYIANVAPLGAASPAGSDSYRFMLFDAYYKGLLLDFPRRDESIQTYIDNPDVYPGTALKVFFARIDRILRYRDFWNWWSSNLFFTFPTARTPDVRAAYKPRGSFPDTEPNFDDIPFQERFTDRIAPVEMEITRMATSVHYEKDPSGNWQWIHAYKEGFKGHVRDAFPDELKPRTLIVLSRNSPYYTRQLNADESSREELAVHDALAGWREAGYSSIDYGRDFADTDYGDRTHLTVSGGRKLATLVAAEVEAMSERLGYIGR